MQIKWYATITLAIAALGAPVEGDVVAIGPHSVLMYCIGSARLEFPGNSDSPTYLFVPWDMRDAYVRAVLNSKIEEDAGVNAQWVWTPTGSPSSDGTAMTFAATGSAEYITHTLTSVTGDLMMYANVDPDTADATSDLMMVLRDNDTLDRGVPYDLGSSGSPGLTRIADANASGTTSISAAAYTQILLFLGGNDAIAWLYDTMEVASHCRTTNLSTVSASNAEIGRFLTSNAGQLKVEGFPAVAVFERRY